MRSKRLTIIVSFISAAMLIAAACTSDVPEGPREPTPEFNPTPAGGSAPAPTATTASDNPAPTQAPASSGPAGDAGNGEDVFLNSGCSACHSTGTNTVIGPGLSGVFARAESRGTGESAEEYLRTAITDPSSYIVDTFTNAMPSIYASTIPADDLQDLIAYLASLN